MIFSTSLFCLKYRAYSTFVEKTTTTRIIEMRCKTTRRKLQTDKFSSIWKPTTATMRLFFRLFSCLTPQGLQELES